MIWQCDAGETIFVQQHPDWGSRCPEIAVSTILADEDGIVFHCCKRHTELLDAENVLSPPYTHPSLLS